MSPVSKSKYKSPSSAPGIELGAPEPSNQIVPLLPDVPLEPDVPLDPLEPDVPLVPLDPDVPLDPELPDVPLTPPSNQLAPLLVT